MKREAPVQQRFSSLKEQAGGARLTGLAPPFLSGGIKFKR